MSEKKNPLDRQVGGNHYKRFAIQPVEYIRKNELGWFEGNIVKYVTRHKFKNGRQDIEKLIHMAECILKEYDEEGEIQSIIDQYKRQAVYDEDCIGL